MCSGLIYTVYISVYCTYCIHSASPLLHLLSVTATKLITVRSWVLMRSASHDSHAWGGPHNKTGASRGLHMLHDHQERLWASLLSVTISDGIQLMALPAVIPFVERWHIRWAKRFPHLQTYKRLSERKLHLNSRQRTACSNLFCWHQTLSQKPSLAIANLFSQFFRSRSKLVSARRKGRRVTVSLPSQAHHALQEQGWGWRIAPKIGLQKRKERERERLNHWTTSFIYDWASILFQTPLGSLINWSAYASILRSLARKSLHFLLASWCCRSMTRSPCLAKVRIPATQYRTGLLRGHKQGQ